MFKSICSFVLVGFVLIVASSEAQAQESPAVSGWAELEVQSKGSEQKAQVATLINFAGNGKVGGYIWAQTRPGYSEAYAGATCSPKSWLQVGAAVGVERSGDATSPRVGGFAWIGKDRFSNLTLLEGAGSGFWYKNQTSVSLPKGVTASLISQRFAGTGPEIEIRVPKTKLSVRSSVLGQDGGPTYKIALRFNF